MTHQSEDHSLFRLRGQTEPRGLAAFLALFLLLGLLAFSSSAGAAGGAGALIGPGDDEDVRALEPGIPIKREIAGGQKHSYQIGLKADQFLKVIVEQGGIDIVVVVIGPDGKLVTEFDSESMPRGVEPVSRVAELDGDYLLIVQPRQRNARAGHYEIRIDELRPAMESDRALQEAHLLCEECLKKQVMGPPAGSETSIERALKIRERVLGPDHPDVAAALNGLGRLYRGRGEYAKAESLFQRALTIQENAFGPEHPALTDSLNNLGHLYRNQADYARAEALFQRVLVILKKSLGTEHPNYAFALHNLGLLYWSKGNYAKAEPLFHQALAIWKNALNPDHPDLGLANNGLGNFYRYRGDYARAETFYQNAISIWKQAPDHDHDLARALNNLAILHRDLGNFEKAEQLANEALSIQEKVLGPEHSDVARTLNNLALLDHDRGDNQRAEPLAKRALAILQKVGEKALGREFSDVATSFNILALICRDRGDYLEAQKLFQQSLAILEKVFGRKHPYVADVLNDMAMLCATMGNTDQAVALQARANEIGEQNLALNLEVGTERQKQAYLAALSKQTDRTISLHLRYALHDPAARKLAAAIILQRKGRALDATSQSVGALRSRSDPVDRALFDQLSEVRSQIAGLVLGEPQRIASGQYHERIKGLEAQVENLEVEISRRSSEYRAHSLPITLESVRAAIPAGAALVEFVAYRPFNDRPSSKTRGGDQYGHPRYVVYVLRKEGEIQWKDLGAAAPIDKAIVLLRESLRDPMSEDVGRRAREVERKVFQPVRPLLAGATRLLISPDGSLNLIPFSALLNQRGQYLVERYSISYLTSGRDLLRLQVHRDSHGGPLVIADPDFGRRSEEVAQVPEPQEISLERNPDSEVERKSSSSVFAEVNFRPLPYAAQEGEALQALLPGSTLLTKREATKAALSQVRSPVLLHVATHGFFLEDPEVTAAGRRGNQAINDDPENPLQQFEPNAISIENPLLRSGLALAGANEPKPEDNGIMTAMEMTGLNLWGTKLVVLSACDSGMGEVKIGDGVHGLRRALVLAGAETQVISLWSVSDKATRELMVSYYRLLQKGQGRGDALRKVQLEMLKKANRRHPHYWASFIQSGEWANLDSNR
jgi:CHAT domain-containing protein/Tfp pilus assembly protein PilF